MKLLVSSAFVGDVIAGHGVTPLLQAAQAAGRKTANGAQMVGAVQQMMVDFMLRKVVDCSIDHSHNPRKLYRA